MQIAARLDSFQVFKDGIERCKVKVPGDFFHARRIAFALDEPVTKSRISFCRLVSFIVFTFLTLLVIIGVKKVNIKREDF